MIKHLSETKICKTCKHKTSDVECYEMFCDMCDIKLEHNSDKHTYLQMYIYSKGEEGNSLEFCSWECCLDYIPKIKCNYFINLPYLTYDEKSNLSVKGFLKEIGIRRK